jgi:hypothetical protein
MRKSVVAADASGREAAWKRFAAVAESLIGK